MAKSIFCCLLFFFGIHFVDVLKLSNANPEKKLSNISSTTNDHLLVNSSFSQTLPSAIVKASAINKKRLRSTTEITTTELTTTQATAEETESTADETTAEFITKDKTKEFTIEETTAEFTTDETTAEFTTEETTTEFTTEETTSKSTTQITTTEKTTLGYKQKSVAPVTPIQAESENITKSWQKYISKSTPKSKTSTKELNKNSKDSSPPSLFTATTGKSDHKNQDNQPTRIIVHKVITQSSINTQNSGSKPTGDHSYQTSTEAGPSANVTANCTSGVDVKIDINVDIKLGSSTTASPGETTRSARYFGSDGNSTTTLSPKNRLKRYEKKKVVAGVLIVVLLSISAACAILFVLIPSKYEVRRCHRRPDQVELINPRRRCRPRFYDASLYMGL